LKTAQLIVRHLYGSKKVTLQGIGTIRLDPSVALPDPADRHFQFPAQAISFEPDSRAPEDEDLVRFIMEQTRKIRPLASSDLESYTLLAKQFLHIGKPVIIEGAGTILRSQTGEYTFTSGSYLPPRSEEISRPLTDTTGSDISVQTNRKSNQSSKLIFILLMAGVLAGGGYAAYRYLNKAGEKQVTENKAAAIPENKENPVPEIPVQTQPTDSTASLNKTDTARIAPATFADSTTFFIVIKEYRSFPEADKRYKMLSRYGHRLLLSSNADSSIFQLQMPFTRALSDTLRMRDSLRIFFGGTPFVLLK
jgi:hypothetical protein